ncbi:MAG: HAD family hydrolase [Clostridia bacterium]|nr:HAD family hydrolase [Clostridia bacterium]
MKITTVLFDLDGTLLPMDQDVFVKAYFGGIAKRLAPHGYDPQKLIGAIWGGTMEMIKNDGKKTNEERFWDSFVGVFGERARNDLPLFDAFYREDFDKVQAVCGHTPKARALIDRLKEKGLRLALATNPVFPSMATESRMRWAGLSTADFALYTTYENSRFCKPNPAYYKDILNALGVCPEECLMVGNDVSDDMVARELGMQVFLLTDCLINKDSVDISVYPNGNFDDLLALAEEL